MAKTLTKDLTVGSPTKLILSFFIPTLFGILFQQCYNMVDTMIVGRYLGVEALAAVGATGSLNFMVVGFCVGVCSGFAIPVAQRFGEKNFVQLRRYVANGAYLSVAFAFVLTIVVGLLCRNILIWMDTPADILDQAYDYIFVIFMGIPIFFLYNTVSGIIRSMGDSKTPLYFLILSSVLNIILDLVFIINFHMGVGGAALATVVSQGVAGISCLLYMKKKFPILKISKKEAMPTKHIMIALCNMGIPMGLQFSITAIGAVVIQIAVNGLGALAVAAVTAGGKVGLLLTCPFDALGSTLATFGGQNIGAKKLDRISQGLRSSVIIAFVYAIVSFLLLYLWGGDLAMLFLESEEPEVLELVLGQSQTLMNINGLFYFPLSIVIIYRFLIQGMGYSKIAIFAGVCEMVARTAAAFLLVPSFGFLGVCFANPLAWIAADAFLVPVYCKIMSKLKRKH